MVGEGPDPGAAVDAVGKRGDLLEAVESEPKTIRDLRDAIGASRSTVYKATRELEALGLLERADGAYRPTLLGRLLHRRFEGFMDDAAVLCGLAPVFATLPADLPVDPGVFADSEVVTPDRHAPDRPVEALERFLADSDRVRSLAPVTRSRYIDFAIERIPDGALQVEAVTERDVVEYLTTEAPEAFEHLLGSEHLTLYETDERLPFGLVVADGPPERVGLTLYDGSGGLRAFVSSTAPEGCAWAQSIYEDYRDGARRLEPGGSGTIDPTRTDGD